MRLFFPINFLPIIYCLLFMFCAGCETNYNAALNHQETLFYSDDKERNLGASVALSVEKQLKISTDIDINERVEGIFRKIVDVCDRKDIIYTVRVIDEDEVNAFSLPGGYVYIYKGLIDKIDNDDQLAGVLGHEVAHIVAKHSLKRLQGAYGATLLQGAAVVAGQPAVAAAADLTASSMFFINSREDEFQADRLGVKYMKLAGYDPRQMKFVLAILLKEATKRGPQPKSYWRSHPYIPMRIAKVEAEASGQMQFKSYLNLTGEER